MKPYTYLIKHRPTGKVYYGFRCANKLEPHNDLWKHYFTSSPKVQQLIEETGVDSFDVEIRRVFETKEQATSWKTRVLSRCKVLEDDRWINQNVAGYIVPTEESRRKISDFHKGKPKSKEHIEKIKKSNLVKNKGRIQTEEHRRKNSEANKGVNNARYGAEVSEETRQKISKANKGKTPVNKGLPMSEEQKAILRETKQRNKVLLTCEVCGKTMRASHFKMYGHGANCSQA
jgi:predicted GIY-YIG superfamily endonuclease